MRLLRQSDAQLFAGWGNHHSIQDTEILQKIDHLANKAASLLQVCNTLYAACACLILCGRIAFVMTTLYQMWVMLIIFFFWFFVASRRMSKVEVKL